MPGGPTCRSIARSYHLYLGDKLLLLSSLGLVERREDGIAGMRARYEREIDITLSLRKGMPCKCATVSWSRL